MNEMPITMAVRFLRAHHCTFTPHLYHWEKKGAKASAEALNLDLDSVVKTLVLETAERKPLLALMDGTHEVSTKTLARLIGTKTVSPVDEKRAEQLTGYQVGGISPFGTRTAMPVYLGEHLLERATIFVNGGKRGFLVELSPQDLQRLLSATAVDMAVSR